MPACSTGGPEERYFADVCWACGSTHRSRRQPTQSNYDKQHEPMAAVNTSGQAAHDRMQIAHQIMLIVPHDNEVGSEDGQAKGQHPNAQTPQETLPVQAEHQDTRHGLLAHPFEACQLSLDLLRAQVSQGLGREAMSRCFCFGQAQRAVSRA